MIISTLHHEIPMIYNFEAIPRFFINIKKSGKAELLASNFYFEGSSCISEYKNYERAKEVFQQMQDAAIRGDKIFLMPIE